MTRNSQAPESAHDATGKPIALLIVLWFAGVAGVGGGLALDLTRNKFDKMPRTYANPTAEQAAQFDRERMAARRVSVAATTGIAGAIIAGVFGMGLGLAGHSPRWAPVGLVTGIVSGTTLVGMGGAIGQHYFAVISSSGAQQSLVHSVLMQFTFWFPLAGGVAVAVGSVSKFGGFFQTVLSTFATALLCSFLVPILTAIMIVVTSSNTRDAIPPDKLSYCLLMTVPGTALLGLILWRDLRSRNNQNVSQIG